MARSAVSNRFQGGRLAFGAVRAIGTSGGGPAFQRSAATRPRRLTYIKRQPRSQPYVTSSHQASSGDRRDAPPAAAGARHRAAGAAGAGGREEEEGEEHG